MIALDKTPQAGLDKANFFNWLLYVYEIHVNNRDERKLCIKYACKLQTILNYPHILSTYIKYIFMPL